RPPTLLLAPARPTPAPPRLFPSRTPFRSAAERRIPRGRRISRSHHVPNRRGAARPVHGRGRTLREPLLSGAHVSPAGGRRGPPLGPVLRGRSRRAAWMGPHP